VDRFYNNIQQRGDCQTTRKPHKTARIVDWVVGWKIVSLASGTPHRKSIA